MDTRDIRGPRVEVILSEGNALMEKAVLLYCPSVSADPSWEESLEYLKGQKEVGFVYSDVKFKSTCWHKVFLEDRLPTGRPFLYSLIEEALADRFEQPIFQARFHEIGSSRHLRAMDRYERSFARV